MDEIPITISQSSSLSAESRASSKLQRTETERIIREEESLDDLKKNPLTTKNPLTPDDSTELTTELDKNIDRVDIRRVEEMINFEREPPRHVPGWNMRTRVTILQIIYNRKVW